MERIVESSPNRVLYHRSGIEWGRKTVDSCSLRFFDTDVFLLETWTLHSLSIFLSLLGKFIELDALVGLTHNIS